MNIKDFTESAIALYLEKGGTIHPDITLCIFQLIEKDENLQSDYVALINNFPGANHTIGKYIRQHFDLRDDKKILITDECKLIKSYTRFLKKN